MRIQNWSFIPASAQLPSRLPMPPALLKRPCHAWLSCGAPGPGQEVVLGCCVHLLHALLNGLRVARPFQLTFLHGCWGRQDSGLWGQWPSQSKCIEWPSLVLSARGTCRVHHRTDSCCGHCSLCGHPTLPRAIAAEQPQMTSSLLFVQDTDPRPQKLHLEVIMRPPPWAVPRTDKPRTLGFV